MDLGVFPWHHLWNKRFAARRRKKTTVEIYTHRANEVDTRIREPPPVKYSEIFGRARVIFEFFQPGRNGEMDWATEFDAVDGEIGTVNYKDGKLEGKHKSGDLGPQGKQNCMAYLKYLALAHLERNIDPYVNRRWMQLTFRVPALRRHRSSINFSLIGFKFIFPRKMRHPSLHIIHHTTCCAFVVGNYI